MRWQASCIAAFLFFAVVCVTGCNKGPKTAKVTGVVKYKGKPLAGANVTFLVSGAPAALGVTDSEGKFTITSVPLGEAKVGITKSEGGNAEGVPSNPTPEDMKNMFKSKKSMKMAEPKALIPIRYADPNKSGLSADVSADSSANDFTFDLKD